MRDAEVQPPVERDAGRRGGARGPGRVRSAVPAEGLDRGRCGPRGSCAEADLVLYDALVDSVALRGPHRCATAHVGKRAGRASVKQETIHNLMIRAARQGKRVVRLKGGDPFVFGRGAEEALALAEAGIPFEVVPGVSTAVAARGTGRHSRDASRRRVGVRGAGRAHVRGARRRAERGCAEQP